MKLIGYVRVSSNSQEDNTSLKQQEGKLRAYCELHGHRLVKIYREVGSGKSMDSRPEFQEAIEALDKADGLIAAKLDRVARNTKEVLQLVEDTLEANNKALVLLDLNIDTSTPIGKMMLTVMAAVASLEREMIKERTQSGRDSNKASGKRIGGPSPYGYDSVKGVLIPIEGELAVIEEARKQRRSGKSYQDVADYLNAKGYKTKRGAAWQSKQVFDVLNQKRKGA